MVLGAGAVGKTSLIQAFINNEPLSSSYSMTLHSEILIKPINIPDTNVTVEFYVHDVGGHEAFLEYLPKHCKGATSFMLVFDLANKESFQSLPNILQVLKHIRTLKNCKACVVGTRADLDRREVSEKEVQDFCKANNLKYFQVSVAQNQGVETPFYYLAHSFHERFEAFLKQSIKSAELL